ncbi:MAG: diphthine synthase [Candidatus Bathyarchaeota archaeon]
MGSLVFIGLGLNDENDLTIKGLEKARKAEEVYIELYTNLMPNFSTKNLEKMIGKRVTVLKRRDLEEKAEEVLIKKAEKNDIALIVPGDPMIATTHVWIRLEAEKKGVKTEVIHAPSIYSAAPSITGLQIYKFGKTVTIPFPKENYKPKTPYEVVKENFIRGLHTLVLLDVDAEKGRWMSIREGLEYLLAIEEEEKSKIVTSEKLVVGLAGLGSEKPVVKADIVSRVLNFDFKAYPQTIIFPGKLHFIEAEALHVLANAPREVLNK